MEPNWKEIGKRLETSRENVPMGKREAAIQMGFTQRALQYHENGSRVKPEQIRRYAALYGVDPHWIMTGEVPLKDSVSESQEHYKIIRSREEPTPDVLLRRAFQVSMEKDLEISRLRSEIEALKKRLRKG